MEKKPEEKSEEKPIIKPKPEPMAPPKLEVTPKPPALPPKPKVVMSKNAEEIYKYLKNHGGVSPPQIAGKLNIDTFEVMKALKELRNQGKAKLSIQSS